MYRNTNAIIHVKNIYENTKAIVDNFSEYKYFFGVVKADCYGHLGNKVISKIVEAGCNYLATATLDEALEIRKLNTDIPILCLGVIPIQFLELAKQNNISITVNSLEYAKQITQTDLKIHIKLNTGMNRLGISKQDEVSETYELLKKNNFIEGIYTHIHTPKDEKVTNKQFTKFEELTSSIDLTQIPIVHLCASYAFENYPKKSYANGVRLGINMYGLSKIAKKSTFELISEVIQINVLQKGETVGYDGKYVAQKDGVRIGVVPIGYADGIIRANTGRYVYINNKKYPIIGNICMDMLFVEIDETVHLQDNVYLIKDNDHLEYIAKYLNTAPYEVICSIGKRVPRIYIDE